MPAVTRFCMDDETGEMIIYGINAETGEPIPQEACQSARVTRPRPQVPPVRFPKGHICKMRKYQTLKANILEGSNVVSLKVLIVPAAAVLPSFVIVLVIILELYLHIQCHKKNKSLKNSNLYYRSPFHRFTSILCAACRDIDSASKIGQLQDQRRHRYAYFKGMAI